MLALNKLIANEYIKINILGAGVCKSNAVIYLPTKIKLRHCLGIKFILNKK